MSAGAIGVSKDVAFYFLSIANASSALGRVLAGLIADKVGMSRGRWTKGIRFDMLTGALNTIVPLTEIMTVVWSFAKNEYQLIVTASIYGYAWHLFMASC